MCNTVHIRQDNIHVGASSPCDSSTSTQDLCVNVSECKLSLNYKCLVTCLEFGCSFIESSYVDSYYTI